MPQEFELVERLDGLFDVIVNSIVELEANFLSDAYSYARAHTDPGYITLVIGGTIRVVM